MIAWIVATALAHGGPPSTTNVVFTDEGWTLETSHGFVTQDGAWICDEIAAEEFGTDLLRPGAGWVLATTGGVLVSDDGCEWTDRAEAGGDYVFGLAHDVADPERIWMGNSEGLRASDRGGPFLPELDATMWLTDFRQASDGRFFLVGHAGAEAVVEIDGTRIALPETSGRMRALGLDDQDRLYVRVPLGLRDHVYRVSTGGDLEDLFGLTDPVAGIGQVGASLVVLHRAFGARWSFDGGGTWSEPVGRPLLCLTGHAGDVYGCPGEIGVASLLRAAGARRGSGPTGLGRRRILRRRAPAVVPGRLHVRAALPSAVGRRRGGARCDRRSAGFGRHFERGREHRGEPTGDGERAGLPDRSRRRGPDGAGAARHRRRERS